MSSSKKQYPLRIDPQLFAQVEKWAHDEFRSTNAHIEFLLRDALRRAGRLSPQKPITATPESNADHE
jgi:hypothetical protein